MREDHTEPKPDTLKPVFVSIAKVFAGAMVGGRVAFTGAGSAEVVA